MTKLVTLGAAALTAFLLSASVASADSWSRHWTGPNGASGTRNVTCGYYGCGFTAQGIGPNGQSWSRSGGTFYAPYHTRSYRSVTGPNGNTVISRRVRHYRW